MLYFSIVSNLKLSKFLGEKSEWLSQKFFHKRTDSDNPLIYQRSKGKKSHGNTTVWRFLQGIQFHTQRKDGANITCISIPQRNCYQDDGALQKAMLCPPDGNTNFFNTVTGTLQGDNLAHLYSA